MNAIACSAIARAPPSWRLWAPGEGARSFEQTFGEVLRALRAERGLLQEGLDHAADSGRTYISQLERGARGPSLKMIFRLARELGIKPSELVHEVEEMIDPRRPI